MDESWALLFWGALCLVLFYLIFLQPFIVKPFLEGMREGKHEIERAEYRFPEHCPMCGAKTLMTHELRCSHCGEDLSPPKY